VLRRSRPTLFQVDNVFVKLAAVAQSFPFSLSLDLFEGATLCGMGTYIKGFSPAKVSSVKGRGLIRLILRGKIDGDGSLETCHNQIKDFFKAGLEFIDQ